jgi:hypothetical protein
VTAEGGWRGNYVMPTSADLFVNSYRRWFDAVEKVPYAAGSVDVHAPLLQGGQVSCRCVCSGGKVRGRGGPVRTRRTSDSCVQMEEG